MSNKKDIKNKKKFEPIVFGTVAVVVVLLAFFTFKLWERTKAENTPKVINAADVFKIDGMDKAEYSSSKPTNALMEFIVSKKSNGDKIEVKYSLITKVEKVKDKDSINITAKLDDSLKELFSIPEVHLYFGTGKENMEVTSTTTDGKRSVDMNSTKQVNNTVSKDKLDAALKLPIKVRLEFNGETKFFTITPDKVE